MGQEDEQEPPEPPQVVRAEVSQLDDREVESQREREKHDHDGRPSREEEQEHAPTLDSAAVVAKRKQTRRAAAGAGRGAASAARGWPVWILVGVLAAAGAFLLAREQATGGGKAVEPPARGLPHTPDYHSLFVFPDDARRLLLGTHVGVYESRDGGVRWRFLGLEGRDAMHFARGEDGTIWVAGHNVLARSDDEARTWTEVHPDGLPSRDIHGFTIASDTGAFYAAFAGEGLYASTDDGESYEEISKEVGPSVYGLAVTSDGAIYAADPGRGVMVNHDGDGDGWDLQKGLDERAVGLATNGRAGDGHRLLVAGSRVQLSDGRLAEDVLTSEEGAGPVAFAPSDPSIAYVVTFDRKLYRSDDGGETWAEVR